MLSSPVPPDIVGEVASHLYHDEADTTPDIMRCSLVSRAFRDHFQPWLFHRVDLVDGKQRTEELAAETARRTARLLTCISERVDLAKCVRAVTLVVGHSPFNEDIPKILQLLTAVVTFKLCGAEGIAKWAQLTSALKNAITALCRQRSLLKLTLFGFPTLPLSLLYANSKIEQLIVTSVRNFTEEEHMNDVAHPMRNIPTTSLTNVRNLTSLHMHLLTKNTWIQCVIDSSGTSGALQTLSLTAAFVLPKGSASFQLGETPFGDPVNLMRATNLKSLNMMCLVHDKDGGRQAMAQPLFEAYCKWATATIESCIKEAALEQLLLQYFAIGGLEPLLQPSFWDIPGWSELGDVIGNGKTRMWLKLRDVKFKVVLFNDPTQPSEISAQALSDIERSILKRAPDIEVSVTDSGKVK